MRLDRKIHISLTEDQHLRLKDLAQRRDISLSELVRRAIQEVYMEDMERDLGADGVRRLGERGLLVSEEEADIGITGPGVLAERRPREVDI